MKKIFTLLLISSVAFVSNAQDTTMVEQYCNLIVAQKIASNKVNIIIDYGEKNFKWNRDHRLKDDQTGKPKEFNSVIDGLNYMGKEGWVLVNAFPVSSPGATFSQVGSNTFNYYFKKQFKRSEID